MCDTIDASELQVRSSSSLVYVDALLRYREYAEAVRRRPLWKVRFR